MPTYHVEMLEGRTLEQKRKLVEEITRVSVEVLGGSPESVDVLITDVKRTNWATGGKLWLEHLNFHLREGDAPHVPAPGHECQHPDRRYVQLHRLCQRAGHTAGYTDGWGIAFLRTRACATLSITSAPWIRRWPS